MERTTDSSAPVDQYHRHEALDRTYLLLEMWDRFIVQHPAVRADEGMLRAAEVIGDAMGDLYQALGGVPYGEDGA